MSIRVFASAVIAVALAVAPAILSASDQSSQPTKATKAAPAASAETTSTSQFATLKGMRTVPMSPRELGAVKGQHVHFLDGNGGFHLAGNPDNNGVGTGNWYDNGSPDGGLVAPSYHGLCVAAAVGPIVIPVRGGALSQCP